MGQSVAEIRLWEEVRVVEPNSQAHQGKCSRVVSGANPSGFVIVQFEDGGDGHPFHWTDLEPAIRKGLFGV